MSKEPRMTAHTQSVLRSLLGRGTDVENHASVLSNGVYGLALTRQTGLPNGTLFPILERLVQCGWVERYWEQDDAAEADGRPRRRYYRITTKGAELAPQALAATAAQADKDHRSGSSLPWPGLTGDAR